MKPERLLAKYGLFQKDTLEEQYTKMKDAFIFLLDRTEERCTKHCDHRSDQERYAGICNDAIPGLNERRHLISTSTERVLLKLDKIDKIDGINEKIAALKAYGKGLAEMSFNGLFMVVLSGELKKRWLPLIESIPDSNFKVSNSSNTI